MSPRHKRAPRQEMLLKYAKRGSDACADWGNPVLSRFLFLLNFSFAAEFGLAAGWLGWAWLGLAGLGWAWLGLDRLGLAGLGWA